MNLVATNASAQVGEDSIIIERIKIIKPHNFEPGDVLVPRGYLRLLQDNREQYLKLKAAREQLAWEIDSLYRANHALFIKLDSAQYLINDMREQVTQVNVRLIEANMDNIEAQMDLEEDWNKFQHIEKRKRGRLVYHFHLLKRSDKIAVLTFGIGLTALGTYLITDMIITNF